MDPNAHLFGKKISKWVLAQSFIGPKLIISTFFTIFHGRLMLAIFVNLINNLWDDALGLHVQHGQMPHNNLPKS